MGPRRRRKENVVAKQRFTTRLKELRNPHKMIMSALKSFML